MRQPPENFLVCLFCISGLKPNPARIRRALASAAAAPVARSSSQTWKNQERACQYHRPFQVLELRSGLGQDGDRSFNSIHIFLFNSPKTLENSESGHLNTSEATRLGKSGLLSPTSFPRAVQLTPTVLRTKALSTAYSLQLALRDIVSHHRGNQTGPAGLVAAIYLFIQ